MLNRILSLSIDGNKFIIDENDSTTSPGYETMFLSKDNATEYSFAHDLSSAINFLVEKAQPHLESHLTHTSLKTKIVESICS